ncbi:hypothetical protein CesoFtcFv8_009647 [Champsocephalus esox]|uniref:Uncharacterized protein n=1 Tax=Champsocephalus esox TaxID=159716 RepID=A0AAN8GZC1_9TELE|nr:hypothetical protein CesoFtcFv8_009647 [Champsocephalus esox]
MDAGRRLQRVRNELRNAWLRPCITGHDLTPADSPPRRPRRLARVYERRERNAYRLRCRTISATRGVLPTVTRNALGRDYALRSRWVLD